MKYRYLVASLLAFFVFGSVFVVLKDYLPRSPGNVTTSDNHDDSPASTQKAGTRPANESKETEVKAYSGPQLLPVDESGRNPDFKQFRDRLMVAIGNRNLDFLRQHVDKNIRYSFGMNDGISGFFEEWGLDVNPLRSGLWDELGEVLALGGTFSAYGDKDKSSFRAPYIFTRFPDQYDAFEYVAVLDKNVDVYTEPDADSRVLTRLNYNIVKLVRQPQEMAQNEADSWVKIQVGPDSGYVKRKFIRSPVDYRAEFSKKNGEWMMTLFVAGD
ncbi:MAG: hypothetical protein C4570_02420 [Ammonifex sp.]|nr:MAG: hypothetical protein C4570_02420 [Ammonifex sp.]